MGSFCSVIESEFDCEKLKFNHDRPLDFVRSQWKCLSPTCFTVYRLLLALAQIGWFFADFIHNFDGVRPFWLLYATNWSFLLYMFTHIALTVECVRYNWMTASGKEIRNYKALWILYSMSITNIIITNLGYWATLFNDDKAMQDKTLTDVFAVVKHSLNASLVISDMLVNAIPVRLGHVIYLIIFTTIYVTFSLIYYTAGGMGQTGNGYIYPQLHWETPGLAIVTTFAMMLLLLLCQFVLFLVYQLRIGLIKLFDADYSKYQVLE